jgi:hypothetical protein
MDHILAEHRVEFGITSAENPRPEHLPECKRKWKMETKTEMTMIHAVGRGTNTVISLQGRILCKGREDGKGRGVKGNGKGNGQGAGEGMEEKGCLLRVVGIIEAHR